MYDWNIAYNYVMKIKYQYMNKKQIDKLDTYSVEDMCIYLNTDKYNNFLKCVNIIVYGTYNLFKYSLIKGGDNDIYRNENSIYREMRGLTIDVEKDTIVLCPFRKFFNIGEIEETYIDKIQSYLKNAKDVEITNKLDGSLLSVRYYDNHFVLGGTGSLDKEQNFRLAEAETMLSYNHKQMIMNNPDKTFIFEYISLNDRHVVIYDKSQQGIYLIGVRNVTNGIEYGYKYIKKEFSDKYHIPMTQIDTKSFNEVMCNRDTYRGSDKEGWVITIDNHRYKLKCTDYLELSHILSDETSSKTIIKAIADDYYDDLLAKVPTVYHTVLNEKAEKIYTYMRIKRDMIYRYYDIVKNINNKSDYGKSVQKLVPKEYQGYMFNLKNHMPISLIKTKAGRYVTMNEIETYLQKTKDLT